MPNGGSDNCRNCRHNHVNRGAGKISTVREQPIWCTVRKREVVVTTHTYCANHYTDEQNPIGPMYGCHGDHLRIPYHDGSYPNACDTSRCAVCGSPSPGSQGVRVIDGRLGVMEFCGLTHYMQWWKEQHPGERLLWDPSGATGEVRAERPVTTLRLDVPFEGQDEVATKLELALALLEIGDRDGARAALEEVLRDGSTEQRVHAQELMKRC